MPAERQASPEQLAAFAHALQAAWPHGPVALGARVGESKQYMSQVMRGKREPRRVLVFAIESAVGLPPGALSHLLGYLPLGSVSIEVAIRQDPALSEEQQESLLAAYRSMAGTAR